MDRMVKFTHYLVTRFNVPLDTWLKDSTRPHSPDAAWFNHRLHLFSTYCVPTVLAQSESNFQWIIYCDAQTEPAQLLELKGILPDKHWISLRYTTHKSALLADLQALLAQSSTPFVITSRLDNDDGLGIDFVHQVQSHFEERDQRVINLQGGVLYDPVRHILTRSKSTVPNSFISLIEKRNPANQIMTVYGFHHTELPVAASVQQVVGGVHWLKIIHHRNVRSQMRGVPLLQIPTQAFGPIAAKEMRVSWISTLFYLFHRLWQTSRT
jgi:hypothetical protein